MNIENFLEELRQGIPVPGGSPKHQMMYQLAEEAMKKTAILNNSYHQPEELRQLFSDIIGKPVDDTFSMFPPFYTECGRNIYLGKNVFINYCCHFQDQGGIYIGDHVMIGSHTVLATINHGLNPQERSSNFPAPIHIGNGVWIGSHVTVLPGVTIGDYAVVAAGAVVTKGVAAGTLVGGVPARVIKTVTP